MGKIFSLSPLKSLRHKLHLLVTFGVIAVLVIAGLTYSSLQKASAYADDEFVTRWTDLPAGELKLKLHGSDNRFIIYWDDNDPNGSTAWNVSEVSHNYTTAGTRNIRIKVQKTGDWKFNGWSLNNNNRPDYLTHVLSWGNIAFTNMSYMFFSGTRLNSLPSDAPNTSQVTDMSYMFFGAKAFNQPVNFDTKNVTSMRGMFSGARAFNQPVNFDTKNVTDMGSMFSGARAFNQPVNFDTKNVTDMGKMFERAISFNQPINFNTSKVSWMWRMFMDTQVFNQPLNFNTSAVKHISEMFHNAKAFNQDLSNFDFSKIGGPSDNKDLNDFVSHSGLSAVNYDKLLKRWYEQNKSRIFKPKSTGLKYCTAAAEHDFLKDNKNWQFNDTKECPTTFTTRWTDLPAGKLKIKLHGSDNTFDIDWDDGTVEIKTNVAEISHNYTSAGTREIKIYASGSGQKFNGWELTTPEQLNNHPAQHLTHVLNWGDIAFTNMSYMFCKATKLNSLPNDAPNTSQVTDMSSMFFGATAFNQPVNFDTKNVTSMRAMFTDAATFNQPVNFDTKNVTNMGDMFNSAKSFNKPVNFNTKNVTIMAGMFNYATTFNQPLNFDTRNVTNMTHMFNHAKSFNHPVNFDTSKVTDISNMFANTQAFNQDLSSLDFTATQKIENFVSHSNLSIKNYDKLLKKWHDQFKDSSKQHAPKSIGLKYCKAATEHDFLKDVKGWTLYDTKDCSDFNLAPTDITLSNTQVNENNAPNFELADITITNDPNDIPDDTNTPSLTCGTAGPDDSSFQIAGNKLILKPSTNFETKNKYNICIRATDSFGKTKDKNFTIDIKDINEKPVITNRTFSIAENSANGTEIGQIAATDPDAGQTLSYVIVNGNDLNIFELTTDGKLKVKDNTNLDFEKHQSVTLKVKVTDSGSPALHTETDITVNITNVNEAPTWTSTDHITINEDSTTEHVLAAADPENNTLSYSAENLPSWITLENGKLTLKPTQTEVGNHEIKLKVSDGTNETKQTLKITVKNVNDAPVWTSSNTITMNEKETLVHALTATDEDGDSLTYSAANLPDWITFSDNKLTLKPKKSEIGTHTLTVNVSDGTTTVSQTITVNVKNVNDAPIITSEALTTATKGKPYSYTITATDEDNDPLTYSATKKPNWLNFDPATQTLSGTPGNSEADKDYEITLAVSDGTATTTQTFTVHVSDKNYAPSITNQTFSVAENTANGTEIGQIAATDPDAGQTLTYSSVSGNDLGIFEITNDGKLKIKDNTNLDYEKHQSITIKVKATDNGTPALHSEADITVNITDINEAPTWTSTDQLTINEDATTEHTLAATDPENNSLTYSAEETLPSWIKLTNNKLTLKPTQTEVGNHEIKLKVSDGTNETKQILKITVKNVNDAPVITSNALKSATEDQLYSYTITATDEDGDPLTYSATKKPDWLNFDPATQTLSGTPGSSEADKDYEITLTVSDGTATTTQTFTLHVNKINHVPSITDQTFTIVENTANGTEVGQVAATDPDTGQTLTYSIVSGNDLNIFEITNDGKLKIKDNTNLDYEKHQSVTLRVKVTDNDSPALSAEADITINITDVDDEAPTITVNTTPITLTVGDTFTAPTATCHDNQSNCTLTTENNVDTTTAGSYHITYTATDEAGNKTIVTVPVTVKAKTPPTPPTPSNPSGSNQNQNQNSNQNHTTKPSSSNNASNNPSLSLSGALSFNPNLNRRSNYRYFNNQFANQFGQNNQTDQNHDADTTSSTHGKNKGKNKTAIFSLKGKATIKLKQGQAYVEPGVKCNDSSSCTVSITGKVNKDLPGTYIITYKGSANGKTKTLTRKVIVKSADQTKDSNIFNWWWLLIPTTVVLYGTYRYRRYKQQKSS